MEASLVGDWKGLGKPKSKSKCCLAPNGIVPVNLRFGRGKSEVV
jgi:hypothetical protein